MNEKADTAVEEKTKKGNPVVGFAILAAIAGGLYSWCAGPSAAEKEKVGAYAEQMIRNTNAINRSVQSLTKLIVEPQPDDAWLNLVAYELATMENIPDEAEKMIPPERALPEHRTYIQALLRLRASAESSAKSIDTKDMSAIVSSHQKLVDAARSALRDSESVRRAIEEGR